MKFVISTRLEIGLNPIANNFFFNQSGLSIFFIFLNNLPETQGHNFSLFLLNFLSHLILVSKLPSIFFIFKFLSSPIPAAKRSLAIPLTDKQSDLFGVIFI